MKKCPYCREEIQDEAVVCKFCRKRIKSTQPRQILSIALILIIFLLGIVYWGEIKFLSKNIQVLIGELKNTWKSFDEIIRDMRKGLELLMHTHV